MSSTLFPDRKPRSPEKTPEELISQIQNNPGILQETLREVKQYGPQKAFYNKCREMGIDPDIILTPLKENRGGILQTLSKLFR